MSHALLIIDLQQEIQRHIEEGRDYTGEDTGANVMALRRAWQQQGLPIIHVHHHDTAAGSPFHPSQPTSRPMACAIPAAGEAVFIKATSSAFASTDLERWLRQQHITDLTLTGAVLGFSISSTARSAHDRGFNVRVVADAVLAFDFHDRGLMASQVYDVELAQLEEGFARLTHAHRILDAFAE